MGLVGKLFKFDAFVYYYGIKFILNNNIWNRLKITLIYTSGPLAVLVIGLLCLYFFDRLKQIKSLLNVFLVWGFIIGTSMFTAQGLIASLGADEYNSPYYQSFAVVFAWWRFPTPLVYALNVPFAILLLYFAVNYTKPFLQFAYSYTKVNKMSRRRRYFLETAILPFFIGAIITTAVTFPMNIFVHAVYLLFIFISLVVGWVALFYLEIMKDDVIKYKSLQTLSLVAIFFLILAWAFVFVTFRGIYLSIT
jgi:hypothetical protein